MPVNTSDASANAREYIARSAEVLGKSAHRISVFNAIYSGGKKPKTVREIMKATGLSRVRVLQEGARLAANELCDQEKYEKQTAYKKRAFIQHNKKRYWL